MKDKNMGKLMNEEKTNKKVAKNIGWMLAGSVFKLLISFFVSVLTARYLGPSNYGVLGYVTSFSTFFTSICNLGINAILVKEILEDKDNEGVVLGSTFFMQTISTLACCVILCVFMVVMNPQEPIYLILAGIQSVYMLINVAHGLTYWFQSRLESKISSIASTVGSLAMAVFRIYLLATNKNIYWFAWATTCDIVVIGAILVGCYIKKGGQPLKISFEKCKRILSRSKHFILAGLMVSLYAQMDKIMLKSMLGPASVGYYTAANSINTMWTFVIAAIIDATSPVIYKSYDEDREKFNKQLKLLYTVVIWIGVLAGIVICISSNWLVNLLYGPSYSESAGILRILVWGATFSYLGVARNIWIVKENKNKYIVFFTLIGFVFNLILNILLIPILGAIGAAIATVASQSISSVLAQLLFKPTRENCLMIFDAFILRKVISKQEFKDIVKSIRKK